MNKDAVSMFVHIFDGQIIHIFWVNITQERSCQKIRERVCLLLIDTLKSFSGAVIPIYTLTSLFNWIVCCLPTGVHEFFIYSENCSLFF